MIMAASLVGFQMGFGMANLLVPDAGQQMTSFSALHRIIVISIFFALNLHFLFINAIAESFQIIPIGGLNLSTSFGSSIIRITAELFAISLQLAAPMLVALLFAMGALGLAARAVPQLNVFVLSFPISFFVGLLVYIATMPFMPEWIGWHIQDNHEKTLGILNLMKP
jgi:flagellar biosynthetic protein FliR